jgi:hypothetical protein
MAAKVCKGGFGGEACGGTKVSAREAWCGGHHVVNGAYSEASAHVLYKLPYITILTSVPLLFLKIRLKFIDPAEPQVSLHKHIRQTVKCE